MLCCGRNEYMGLDFIEPPVFTGHIKIATLVLLRWLFAYRCRSWHKVPHIYYAGRHSPFSSSVLATSALLVSLWPSAKLSD